MKLKKQGKIEMKYKFCLFFLLCSNKKQMPVVLQGTVPLIKFHKYKYCRICLQYIAEFEKRLWRLFAKYFDTLFIFLCRFLFNRFLYIHFSDLVYKSELFEVLRFYYSFRLFNLKSSNLRKDILNICDAL